MEPDEKKTPFERLADPGDTVLKVVAVLFAIAACLNLTQIRRRAFVMETVVRVAVAGVIGFAIGRLRSLKGWR